MYLLTYKKPKKLQTFGKTILQAKSYKKITQTYDRTNMTIKDKQTAKNKNM